MDRSEGKVELFEYDNGLRIPCIVKESDEGEQTVRWVWQEILGLRAWHSVNCRTW